MRATRRPTRLSGGIVGGPDRHIGVALGEIERAIAHHEVEPDIAAFLAKAREDRRQKMDQERVIGGDTQFAGGRDFLAGEPSREAGDVVIEARSPPRPFPRRPAVKA